MEISDIRHMVGMSQRTFADYFGIPVGTLRNWEQGIAKPPEYVYTMIFRSMRRDVMINVETMKLIKTLDCLAAMSENGIEEFKHATQESYRTTIFYSEKHDNKIVADACIIDDEDYYHHDVISFYEDEEYVIKAVFDEDTGKPYMLVRFTLSDWEIVIEDGRWYFV